MVAVATSGALRPWQMRCVNLLSAVPGVAITWWPQGTETAAPLEAEPDLLLDLTDSGVVLQPDSYVETWHFAFGNDSSRDLAQTVLVEYVLGRGITRIALISDRRGGVVREGWVVTPSWWHPSGLDRSLLAPAGWVADGARELAEGLSAGDQDSDPRQSWVATSMRTGSSVPSPILATAALGRRIVDFAGSLRRHDDWNVGILDASIESMLKPNAAGPIVWLPGRPDHSAADPFGLERDGILHVVYEDIDQRNGIGSIYHVSLDAAGTFSESTPVLRTKFHASYPFLIEHQGAVFMLPEIAGSGDLVLYEAVDFPTGWRPALTLLPGIPAVDASVVYFEDRWWMFACRADHGVDQDLFIWHARDLFGPWVPHRANPVKTDARSARPGGTPFVCDSVLYRPSQDDSRVYGGRLIINEVVTLTPTAFVERQVRAVEPRIGSSRPDGLHTLSGVGRRTLIDGNIRRFVPGAFLNRINLGYDASSRATVGRSSGRSQDATDEQAETSAAVPGSDGR